MPGIAGVITKRISGKENRKLDFMLKCMLHEPFYNSSTYTNSELGFYIGGVSIKGSFCDCMPIYNEKKNMVLFFSGESYSDQETIDSLPSCIHDFNLENSSYLIHLYEEHGELFLKNLNGLFCGIIIDCQQEKAILFNDRYGMKRIYYYEDENAFYFSSEAKALLKVIPSLRNIDLKSVAEYFAYDCILENRTYFANINLLPNGSSWCFLNGDVNKKQYFDLLEWENQPIIQKEHAVKKLIETFKKILPRYFSGKSIGMSLTGGLDTRMILSCYQPAKGELPCYTFGGMYRDSFDVRTAKQVAKACFQKHQILKLDQNFLSEFAFNAEKTIFVTDGLADVCKSHSVYLNRLARDIAPIRMTGKFGSQVFRAASMLRDRSPNQNLFANDFTEFLIRAKETFRGLDKRHALSFMLFKEIPWYWAGFYNAEASQITVRSPYLDNDLVKLIYQVPIGSFDGSEFQLKAIEDTNPRLSSIRTNRGQTGSDTLFSKLVALGYFMINNADKLYNWDRMPHRLARLDHLFTHFHLERLVLGYDQYNHYRIWFKKDLSDYLKAMILDNRTFSRPYWNKKFLEKIVHDHTSGKGNYLLEIRKILTLELIHRILLEAC